MCCLCDECNGLNENSKLTEIWLFSEEQKKTNYDIKFTHGFKSSQKKRTVNFLTNADE